MSTVYILMSTVYILTSTVYILMSTVYQEMSMFNNCCMLKFRTEKFSYNFVCTKNFQDEIYRLIFFCMLY